MIKDLNATVQSEKNLHLKVNLLIKRKFGTIYSMMINKQYK